MRQHCWNRFNWNTYLTNGRFFTALLFGFDCVDTADCRARSGMLFVNLFELDAILLRLRSAFSLPVEISFSRTLSYIAFVRGYFQRPDLPCTVSFFIGIITSFLQPIHQHLLPSHGGQTMGTNSCPQVSLQKHPLHLQDHEPHQICDQLRSSSACPMVFVASICISSLKTLLF